MSLRLVIPWRVALQQSSPPLHKPMAILNEEPEFEKFKILTASVPIENCLNRGVHPIPLCLFVANLDHSQDSLLDSTYLPNRASTQSCVLGQTPTDTRVRRSLIFSNSMEVHGGLQSRPESRLPESWNRDHRANRTEANRLNTPALLYASSCC